MSLLAWLDAHLCVRMAWTLLHFLWQGAAIALLATGVLWALRRRSANVRYLVLLSALGLMAACPPVTFLLVGAPAAPMSAADGPSPEIAAVRPNPPASVQPPVAMTVVPNSTELAPTVREPAPPSLAAPAAPATAMPAPSRAAAVKAPVAASPWERLSPYVVAGYAVGVLVMFVRLMLGLLGGRRLRNGARPIDSPTLLATLARRAKALGLAAAPVVAYCQRVAVPTVVGVLRPMILLPLSLATGLTSEQIEAILTHELAHIRRYDHLLNIIQRTIEAMLFFHPAVWFISRQTRIEREHCCDDAVVACGGEPVAYASLLVQIAEMGLAAGGRGRLAASAALAATEGKPSQLRGRVLRLLDNQWHETIRLRRGWPMVLIGLAAGLVLAASLLGKISAQAAGPDAPATAQAAATQFAQQIAQRYVTPLRERKYAWLTQAKLASLEQDIRDFAARYPAKLSPADQQALLAAVEAYSDQSFRVADTTGFGTYISEQAYMALCDQVNTFKWRLWLALTRPEPTAAQARRRDAQHEWIRQFIASVPARPNDARPEGAKPGEEAQWARARVEEQFANPLSLVHDAMTDVEFEVFQKGLTGTSGNGLYMTVAAIQEYALVARVHQREDQGAMYGYAFDVPLPFNDPVVELWGGIGPHLAFASNALFCGRYGSLGERSTFDVLRCLDYRQPMSAQFQYPPDVTFESWLTTLNKGDLGCDDSVTNVKALRGAKMARLDVRDWFAADALSNDQLRQLIAQQNLSEVSVDKLPPMNGPYRGPHPGFFIAVRTAEDRLAVVDLQYREFGTVRLWCRARPEPGNTEPTTQSTRPTNFPDSVPSLGTPSGQDSTSKPYSEKEATLSRLISQFPGVQQAKVVLEAGTALQSDTQPTRPTATVSLRLKPGNTMNRKLVASVADLVAGSVARMTRLDVHIVDAANGRSYRADEDEQSATSQPTASAPAEPTTRGIVSKITKMRITGRNGALVVDCLDSQGWIISSIDLSGNLVSISQPISQGNEKLQFSDLRILGLDGESMTVGHREMVFHRPSETIRIRADADGVVMTTIPLPEVSASEPASQGSQILRAEEVELSFAADGSMRVDQIVAKGASALQVTQRSGKPGKVQAKVNVVDAETGQPVKSFKAIWGESRDNGRSWSWFRFRTQSGADGTLDLTLPDDLRNAVLCRIRIESEGHIPSMSASFPNDGQMYSLNFKLTKGEPVRCTILQPDGKPASGIKAYLAQKDMHVGPSNGKIFGDDRFYVMATTDAQGRCEFGPQGNGFTILAVDEAGYVQVASDDLVPGQPLTLQRWTKIQGIARIGEKPVSGVDIRLQTSLSSVEGGVMWDVTAHTDENGQFSMDYVPAGQASFYMGGRDFRTVLSKFIEPGQAINVTLGGGGRTVTGKLLPVKGKTLKEGQLSTKLARIVPELSVPADLRAKGGEELRNWFEQWQHTKEGRAWLKEQRENEVKALHYTFPIAPDGSFSIEDVQPGDYELSARAAMPGNEQDTADVGLRCDVTVQAPTANQSPQDLGQLELKKPDRAPTTQPASQPATQPAVRSIVPTLEADLAGLCGEIVLTLGWSGEQVRVPGPLVWPEEARKTLEYRIWQYQKDIRTLRFTDKAGRRWENKTLGRASQDITVRRPDGTLLATGSVLFPSGPSHWEVYDAAGEKPVFSALCQAEKKANGDLTGRWSIADVYTYESDGAAREWQVRPNRVDVVRGESITLPSGHMYYSAYAEPYMAEDQRYSPELRGAAQTSNVRVVVGAMLANARDAGLQDVVARLVLPGSPLAGTLSDLPALLKGGEFSVPTNTVVISGDRAQAVATRKTSSGLESWTLHLVQLNGHWLISAIDAPIVSVAKQPATQPASAPTTRAATQPAVTTTPTTTAAVSNPLRLELAREQLQLERDLELNRSRYGPEHRMVKQMEARLDIIRKQLKAPLPLE